MTKVDGLLIKTVLAPSVAVGEGHAGFCFNHAFLIMLASGRSFISSVLDSGSTHRSCA